jgi:hypothetical protein
MNTYLDENVWGPLYWKFLYTIALTYPNRPNDVTKRKYYDLLMNFPLFIPNENMGNTFSKFLDNYPPQAYLTSRESFIKWVCFIHNKINVFLGKPEMGYLEAMDAFYEDYKPNDLKKKDERKNKHKFIFASIMLLLITVIIFLHFNNK